MKQKNIVIDLGTSNIRISVSNEDAIVTESNIVAIDIEENRIVEVGKNVNNILGKEPKNIKIIYPIKNGIVTDSEVLEILLKELIKKVYSKKVLFRPNILINYPSNITEVEKEAIITVLEKLGAKKIYLKESILLAAMGAGIKISKPSGNMIIDIGHGTTDIGVISLNNIVASKSINIAGNQFNKDIIQYIKENYQVTIGEITASKIKTNFGVLSNNNKDIEITGINIITSVPKTIKVNQLDIKKALNSSTEKIISEIKSILESTKPELLNDILSKGIVLTGGSSQMDGIRELLQEELGIKVLQAQNPNFSVIEGEKMYLNNIKTKNKL